MALDTPFKHIGYRVRFDALIPLGCIDINPADWDSVQKNTHELASKFQGSVEDAQNDTQISAQRVGPLSGPDATTGPLIPVARQDDNIKLPTTPGDTHPNPISPIQADTQDDFAGTKVSLPSTQPYATADVPPVPTEVKHTTDSHFEAPDTQQFPEHPELENQPPSALDGEAAPEKKRKRKSKAEEVFADAEGKTIGTATEDGGYENVRDNPFPPEGNHGDLTGRPISEVIN